MTYLDRFFFLTLCLFILILNGSRLLYAQEPDTDLQIGQVDISQFPLVRLNLVSANSTRIPLTINDFEGLTLREGGIPVVEFDLQPVPVGVDVIFVIDANQDFQLRDDTTGLTRQQKVQESIVRFAERVMSPSGLDRVSIVVANEANDNGRFLLQDASQSTAVVDAIGQYTPASDGPVPLNEMMQTAIQHAADIQEIGRFQAILLFTDAGETDTQLDLTEIITAAQSINLPLFTAILGAQADLDEIANATALTDPTRAAYIHMPNSSDTDPIYLTWQQQGNQPQLTYRSQQTSSGSVPISVNVGQLFASTTLELNLAPPQVAIHVPHEIIQRTGDTPDTPLAELTPTTTVLTVTVTWPDGLPRQITAVNWFINAQPQPPLTTLTFDENGQLPLTWDIQTAAEGTYEHRIQITDELGFSTDSDLTWLTIAEDRPQVATPTPVPTTAPETPTAVSSAIPLNNLLILLAVVGATALILILLRRVRRRRRQQQKKRRPQPSPTAPTNPTKNPPVRPDPTLQPFLEIMGVAPGNVARVPLPGDNITIGRDPQVAQIIFEDASISRLHARIRRRGDAYWLYDEGSATGTSLNYERLGLAPHILNNQDTIQLGRISLRFRLTSLATPDKSDDGATAETADE